MGHRKKRVRGENKKFHFHQIGFKAGATTIDLRCENIDDVAAHFLSETLSHNSTVKELLLGCNRIGDDGAEALASLLDCNTSISALWLGDNLIGPRGAAALADALTRNATLSAIDLHCNELGDDGVKSMAGALKSNHALRWIDLYDNAIHDEGGEAMVEAISHNGFLLTVNLIEDHWKWHSDDVGSNDIGWETLDRLDAALDFNRTHSPGVIAEASKKERIPDWFLERKIAEYALPSALEKISAPNVEYGTLCLKQGEDCTLSVIYSFVREKHSLMLAFSRG